MKMYKLMTKVGPYQVGSLHTFEQKHKLMADLSWEEQRYVLWVTVDRYDH